MRIQVMMKTPDALDNALEGLPDEELVSVEDKLEKWFKYREQVILEIDTENKSIRVIEQ